MQQTVKTPIINSWDSGNAKANILPKGWPSPTAEASGTSWVATARMLTVMKPSNKPQIFSLENTI
jgi:hypothetical protein